MSNAVSLFALFSSSPLSFFLLRCYTGYLTCESRNTAENLNEIAASCFNGANGYRPMSFAEQRLVKNRINKLLKRRARARDTRASRCARLRSAKHANPNKNLPLGLYIYVYVIFYSQVIAATAQCASLFALTRQRGDARFGEDVFRFSRSQRSARSLARSTRRPFIVVRRAP